MQEKETDFDKRKRRFAKELDELQDKYKLKIIIASHFEIHDKE